MARPPPPCQSVVLPDRLKEASLAQQRLASLRDERSGTLALRNARSSEVAALSQRLDALMSQADALRREQGDLVSNAAKGAAESRLLAMRQARLRLDTHSMVQRVEDLRARRDAEQVGHAADDEY
jgi:hypothetical protein